MVRPNPRRPTAIRGMGAATSVYALAAMFSVTGQAGQLQPLSAGLYSAAQALRGQQIYQNQCADCHGATLEGAVGPPMAGEAFLSAWSARPLADLVDKIQKTMPFGEPGRLSRAQATDLTAFIVQSGGFPAGEADLSESALAQVTFPALPTAAAPAEANRGASLPPPEGNLAELMRAIAFPNANVIFNLQIKDPAVQPKKPLATSPFDYVEWGATVYPGWLAVDQAAVAITETAPLLLTPGRRCQNGRPVPVDRPDWKGYVAALVDVGKLARRTSQARNFAAFVEISEKLNEACANCHKVYRDKGGPEGSGAARCQ